MRALVWNGKRDVRVETVKDPVIQEPTVTSPAVNLVLSSIKALRDDCRMGGAKRNPSFNGPVSMMGSASLHPS